MFVDPLTIPAPKTATLAERLRAEAAAVAVTVAAADKTVLAWPMVMANCDSTPRFPEHARAMRRSPASTTDSLAADGRREALQHALRRAGRRGLAAAPPAAAPALATPA